MDDAKLTQDELQAIKERADKATPGPWESNGAERVYTKDDDFVKDFDYGTIAYGIDNDSDAEFIAHARQDIPKLVAEVERLQAQEHFAEYVIRQNKALWEALSKACASLGADTIDYYEEEGGI